jgi:hypothetical protein
MTLSFSRSLFLATFLLQVLLWACSARSQIASPVNAGQNSGNNTSASSSTTIGTPNFSQPLTLSLVSGMTVQDDGTLEADPELLRRLQQVLDREVSRNPALPRPPLGGGSLLLASLAGLPITSAVPSSGSFTMRDSMLQVSIGGELVDLPTTPVNQAALRRFAQEAIRAGFTPSSLGLGAQLVGIGTPVAATLELMGSLQGLAAQPNLNALARGIAAFNAIVNGASPALRAQLDASPVFIAAGNVLRSTREALPAKR